MSKTPALNQDQQHAVEVIRNYLMDDSQKYLNISGPAGVGKTFLMNHVINVTLEEYIQGCRLLNIRPKYDLVTMTATTNKAAEVLGVATNRPTSTVHSFFNLTVFDDYQTGKTVIKKGKQWQVHKNLIIFIDEGSFVDSALLKHIDEGTMNCKVIFVGDICQLAPVGESVSPIYRQGWLSCELLTPMRNAGQPVLQTLCSNFRKVVDFYNQNRFKGVKEYTDYPEISLVPGVIDHLSPEELEAEIAAKFIDPNYDARILAFQNATVINYNRYVRDVRQLPNRFQAGEHLISNSAIRQGKTSLTVEGQVTVLKNHGDEHIYIGDSGTQILCQILDIENEFGEVLTDVPVAVNPQELKNYGKNFTKNKDWINHFFIKNTFPDLRECDACTVYKAQGSTYDTVYVDLSDISTCRSHEQLARMLYVAVSRARNRVVFFGDLA